MNLVFSSFTSLGHNGISSKSETQRYIIIIHSLLNLKTSICNVNNNNFNINPSFLKSKCFSKEMIWTEKSSKHLRKRLTRYPLSVSCYWNVAKCIRSCWWTWWPHHNNPLYCVPWSFGILFKAPGQLGNAAPVVVPPQYTASKVLTATSHFSVSSKDNHTIKWPLKVQKTPSRVESKD